MSLSLELTLRQDIKQTLEALIPPSCLPRCEARLRSLPEPVREPLTDYVTRTSLRSTLDALLGLLEPKQRRGMVAFYKSGGPNLERLLSWTALQALDVEMSRRLESLVAWIAVFREAMPDEPPDRVFRAGCTTVGVDPNWDRSPNPLTHTNPNPKARSL